MLDRSARVFVAGHRGVVGSAIVRRLRLEGFEDLVLRTREELDLGVSGDVEAFLASARPDVVIVAAARVGGIAANMADPVGFLVDNLAIQDNVLPASVRHGASQLMFLGSSCVYPRLAPQPMSEDVFMTGPLEPTNESYAIAKIAGIRLARALHEQAGVALALPMPSNVYGPGDHFGFDRAHVLSSLVRRFSEAVAGGVPMVTLWGTGTARRELLHVDDLADACLHLLDQGWSSEQLVNVGTGVDHTIAEIADLVADAVGFRGEVEWDTSKPDGMPRKVLDVARLQATGWHHRIDLEDGVRSVVEDFRTRFPDGVPAS